MFRSIYPINTDLSDIGTIVEGERHAVTEAQVVFEMGNMYLPKGKYIVTASASISTTDGVVGISISTTLAFSEFRQMIYGVKPYDINTGSVTAIMDIPSLTKVSLLGWSETNITLTPLRFIAIKIG